MVESRYVCVCVCGASVPCVCVCVCAADDTDWVARLVSPVCLCTAEPRHTHTHTHGHPAYNNNNNNSKVLVTHCLVKVGTVDSGDLSVYTRHSTLAYPELVRCVLPSSNLELSPLIVTAEV